MNFITAFILAFVKNVVAPTVADIVRYIICDYADQILGEKDEKEPRNIQVNRSELARNHAQAQRGKRLRFMLIAVCLMSTGYVASEAKDHVRPLMDRTEISIPFDGK